MSRDKKQFGIETDTLQLLPTFLLLVVGTLVAKVAEIIWSPRISF